MPKERDNGFTIIEVLIVLAIAGLIIALSLISVPKVIDSKRKNQARKELKSIVTAAGVAQQYYGKPLRLVTGNGCSDCICRPPAQVTDSGCITNWTNAMNAISTAGLDISNLDTDPWGSPYLLDENEGEMGTSDCRLDNIRSAGSDGIMSTADDISFSIPLRANPCPFTT